MALEAISTIETIVKTTEVKARTKAPQFVAALTVSLISYAYGCATGWLSPTQPLLQSEDNPPVGGSPITDDDASWLSSLPFLGALAASPIFSAICERFGRKAAGYVTAFSFIVCWIVTFFSTSVYHLYIARFLAGIGNGGVIVFMPMYCGEIAEDDIRGALGTILPLVCNIGTVVTYSAGSYVSLQVLALISLVVPLVFSFIFYFLPETPVYLTLKDKHAEATNAMMWLRCKNKTVVERDLDKIKTLTQKNDQEVSKKDVFFSRGTLKALSICISCCIAQHLSGVYVILNYCAQIMSSASKALSPEISSIAIGVLQMIGSLLAPFLVESVGRKTLLIITEIIMGINLTVLGTYFYFQSQEYDLSYVSYLPVICVSLYLFFNAIGVAPVTYVLISETFHPDIRSTATSIVTSSIWTLAFLVTKLYPFLLAGLGLYGCFWVFSAVCVACTVFTVFQIPETKNRSLESILQELNGENSKPILPV